MRKGAKALGRGKGRLGDPRAIVLQCEEITEPRTRSSLVLRIVSYPHPALRYPSRPVTRIDDDLRSKVRAMFDLMYEARGIGLAANQVALPYRFFILNLTADPEQKDQERVIINPEIVKRHSSIEDEEGCLSFPGLYGKVRRAKKIKVQAFDLAGNSVELDAEDLFSRAIQHETDHLEGKLFIDHLSPLARASATPKIREFEAKFRQAQASGEYPDDAEIIRQLDAL
jgi:peptide deformylase